MKIAFNEQDKLSIAKLVEERFTNSGFNRTAFSKSLGLRSEDMSNLFGRKWLDNASLLGINKWIRLARFVEYTTVNGAEWVTARTDVYEYIMIQLQACQRESMTGILVDDAGIGKTWACKSYAKHHKAVFYIDGSVYATKRPFIRAVGRAVGVGDTGKLDDILEDAIYALESMETPIVIIDEAGDLDNKTLLVLKRIFNALDGVCGFYLVGADGLKHKIERGIANKQLGYVEIFSRYGKDFKHVLPKLIQDKQEVLAAMATQIAAANGLTKEEVKEVVMGMSRIEGFGDLRTAKRKILGMKVKR